MRSPKELERVRRLIDQGLNNCEISRSTGVPLTTVRRWKIQGPRAASALNHECPVCGDSELEAPTYSYLLGLYLGDGCIVETKPGLFRLEITLDAKYPKIIHEAREAIQVIVRSGMAGIRSRGNCIYMTACWKHWVCLFPQHGPGHKHERRIVLRPWQEEIVVAYPELFLRGLIHSDGSRDQNFVRGKAYPRYQFKNESNDIKQLFCRTCESLGIHWTRANRNTVSIARRADVLQMDSFIGPKK